MGDRLVGYGRMLRRGGFTREEKGRYIGMIGWQGSTDAASPGMWYHLIGNDTGSKPAHSFHIPQFSPPIGSPAGYAFRSFTNDRIPSGGDRLLLGGMGETASEALVTWRCTARTGPELQLARSICPGRCNCGAPKPVRKVDPHPDLRQGDGWAGKAGVPTDTS